MSAAASTSEAGRFALLGLGLLLLATPAEASSVRNYFSPTLDGIRVAACLSGGGCGKPAADAFCKGQGFEKAMIFERQPSAETRSLDSGALCKGGSCVAFKQVKCFSGAGEMASLPQ